MANEYLVNKSDLTSVANAIRTKGETSAQLVFPSGFMTAIQNMKGGAELNFEVIGSTTQPSNPKENTIWIKTNNSIAGWTFAAVAPSNPVANMVWIKTNTVGSSFNALKENALYVYIDSVYQYASGTWASKETKIYQGGKWVALWNGELYQSGDEYEYITGGWGVNGYSLTFDGDVGTLREGTKTSSYLQTNYEAGWNFYMFGTQSLIDLTNVDHIEIDVEYVSGEKLYIFASPTKAVDFDDTVPQIKVSKSGIINLDVSGINSAYIAIVPYPLASDPAVWRIHSVRCV